MALRTWNDKVYWARIAMSTVHSARGQYDPRCDPGDARPQREKGTDNREAITSQRQMPHGPTHDS
eukprot:5967750-Alexandrium_andersonii.AAC.1